MQEEHSHGKRVTCPEEGLMYQGMSRRSLLKTAPIGFLSARGLLSGRAETFGSRWNQYRPGQTSGGKGERTAAGSGYGVGIRSCGAQQSRQSEGTACIGTDADLLRVGLGKG